MASKSIFSSRPNTKPSGSKPSGTKPSGTMSSVAKPSKGMLPGAARLSFLLKAVLCCIFFSMSASHVLAANAGSPADSFFAGLPAPAAPYLASITSKGASILAKEEQNVLHEGKEASVRLLLPKDARDMQFRVHNALVGGIEQKTVSLPAGNDAPSLYAELLAKKNRLSAEILWLSTKISQAENSAAAKAGDDIQAACTRIVAARAELEEVSKSLAEEKAPESVWQLVTLRLVNADSLKKAQVSYSYNLPGCSWKPVYTINCTPEGNKPVSVRLEAVISQTSGIDWKETEIQLVSGNTGSAVLPAIRQWHIGSAMETDGPARPMTARLGAPAARMALSNNDEEEADPDFVGSSASAAADTGKGFMAWKPVLKGLAAGTSRVLLAESAWQEKLFWTARPLSSDAKVYICAEHTLAPEEAMWPDGAMQLHVDGIYAGQGTFAPRNGKILLSFGNDPRVTLTAQAEPRKKGRTGLIGTRQVWEWGWTYTVRNDRDREIDLRVERPLPVSTNKDIEIAIEGTPKPEQDQKEKKLVWKAAVPAGSAVSIQHSVKATAPKDMEMYPTEP